MTPQLPERSHTWRHVCPLVLLMQVVMALSMSAQSEFDSGCPVPFGDLKSTGRPVDRCPTQGESSNESQLAQNLAKNNLCVAMQPVPVTQLSFARLQAAVEQKGIPFGNARRLPQDRAALRSIYK